MWRPRKHAAESRQPEGHRMDDKSETREEGFYWVVLGQNPPEVAYWERAEWWLCGNDQPWQPDAVTVISDRLVFRPRLSPVA
jgi:hypothetical protein